MALVVESVCICGPSPTYIGPWKIIRGWMDAQCVNVNWITGQRLTGLGALYHRRFMLACGVPYIGLDRRAWTWTAYDARNGDLVKLGSWPDTRPYPYPESARRRG